MRVLRCFVFLGGLEMPRESVWLVSFAVAVVVCLFFPSLLMAALCFSGLCPYAYEKHAQIYQWAQIVWMLIFLHGSITYLLIGKRVAITKR